MGPMVVDRDGSLDRHTDEWVDPRLISSDQAAALEAFEGLVADEPAPRFTVVAEVATYVGSIIAIGGGLAIVGPNRSQIGFGGQLVLATFIAVVGFVAGRVVMRIEDGGAQRLGSFLQVIATGGVALAVGLLVGLIVDPGESDWYWIAIGSAVFVTGTVLWRNLERPLQLSTAAIGLTVLAGGVVTLVGLTTLQIATVMWVAGAAFGGATAAGYIVPRSTAFGIAAVGMMGGAFRLAGYSPRLSAYVAVASAAVIVIVALIERSWLLVAIGLVAFLLAVVERMGSALEGTLARLIAVAAGLAAVAFVALRASHRGSPT